MVGSLLTNFRKILEINFFLFILSLFLFAELLNGLYLKNDNLFQLFTDLNFVIPYILLYLFTITVLTPMTKYFVVLLSIVPFIDKVIDFFKDKKNEELRNRDYISLVALRDIALKKDSKMLYDYYLHKEEEHKSMQFTAQYSYVNLMLIIANYIFVANGAIQQFFVLNNWVLNLTIGIPLLAMLFVSITYFQNNDKVIYKMDIPE